MKANLTLHHNALEQHFQLGGNLPDIGLLAGRIVAMAKAALARWSKALHPLSADEAYLAQSQNIAELEKRMLELQSHDSLFSSSSYW